MKKIYLVVFAVIITCMAFAQNFTPGNLVIYRAGDGSTALTNAAAPVFLDEYTVSGTLVQSIAMPTTTVGSNRKLVVAGSGNNEGLMTLSADKKFLLLPGIDATVGTAGVNGIASSTANRVVGIVNNAGVVNTTTAFDAFSGQAMRTVCSDDGNKIWVAGGTIGVLYTTAGSTSVPTTLSSTITNHRGLGIFNGQLFASHGSGTTQSRIMSVGTGLPTTSTSAVSLLGIPTTSLAACAFYFADLDAVVPGLDVLYLADDLGGAVRKYSLVSGTWVLNSTIALATVRGLTGSKTGSTINLYVTSGNGSTFQSLSDASGYNAAVSSSFVSLVTAGTNKAFRGIAFTPELPTTPSLSVAPSTLNITTASGTASASQSFALSGINLTGFPSTISVTPSAGLEISTDDISFTTMAVTVNYTVATLASTTLYTRIAASAAAGALLGTVTCAGAGAPNAVVNVNGTVTQNFYSKPTGNLSDLSTWGPMTSGMGTSPIDFTSPYQIFNVVNRTNAVPGAHWEVTGAGSKIIIGDGTNPTTVTTSITDTIKAITVVDIFNNGTLEMGSRVAPTFGMLAGGSTVDYNLDGTTTDTVKINVANYHNLKLTNGLKYLRAGTTTVNGDLLFDGTKGSNGPVTSFATISLKGNLTMTNNALIEDSTTGFANRFTLTLSGTNPTQTINTGTSELRLFRLQRDSSVLSNVDIILTANSKICIGNAGGGDIKLLQKVGTPNTITKLIMNPNSQLAIVKNGSVLTDIVPAKSGTISATNAKIIINKSVTSATAPGTLKFENFSSLNQLTINVNTPTKDSVGITNINGMMDDAAVEIRNPGNLSLTKGVLVVAPTQRIILEDAVTVTGGNASSYVDGRLNKGFSGPATFVYPVGKEKQFSPVEISSNLNAGVGNNYTVEYVKQAYSNLTVSTATAIATPGYTVSNKEYWNIERGDLSGTPNVKFYYNNPSSGISNAANARIAHFNGTDWDDINRDADGSDANGTYIQKNGIVSFSPFTFGGPVGVLPVLLESFNGTLQNNNSTLQWKTSCETVGDKFELQYSVDGRNYATINNIDAKGTCVGNIYTYTHTDAKAVVNYYRLITISTNGAKTISNVIALKNSKLAFDIKLVSTNTNEQIGYSIASPTKGKATLQITNMQGQVMIAQNITYAIGTQIKYINTSNFSKGLYFLIITNNDGEKTTAKFVK